MQEKSDRVPGVQNARFVDLQTFTRLADAVDQMKTGNKIQVLKLRNDHESLKAQMGRIEESLARRTGNVIDLQSNMQKIMKKMESASTQNTSQPTKGNQKGLDTHTGEENNRRTGAQLQHEQVSPRDVCGKGDKSHQAAEQQRIRKLEKDMECIHAKLASYTQHQSDQLKVNGRIEEQIEQLAADAAETYDTTAPLAPFETMIAKMIKLEKHTLPHLHDHDEQIARLVFEVKAIRRDVGGRMVFKGFSDEVAHLKSRVQDFEDRVTKADEERRSSKKRKLESMSSDGSEASKSE